MYVNYGVNLLYAVEDDDKLNAKTVKYQFRC